MYVLEPVAVAGEVVKTRRGNEGRRTLFLDAGSVLEVLGGILVAVIASLEFDEFHGKRFAQQSLCFE